MKRFFLLFIFTASLTFAQYSYETLYLSPSVYFTNGNYSTSVKSNSISFYNTLQLIKEFYLINHYDHLLIDDKEYDYKQQTFLAGGIVDLFPYYIKFSYAHYKGDFDYKPFSFSFNDYTNLYNIDLVYYVDWFYLGAAYTHLNQIGFAKAASNQVTVRLERILSNEFFISVKPNFTRLDNGKNLFSASLKLHYAPIADFLLKVGGFAGERAFYFDSDLLTIFNQNYVQKYQAFGQVEYSLLALFNVIAGYQHNKFTDFNVDYLYAGIKGNFQIAK
ncbi:MAG: hypothetical protein A2315_16955 [Ignavibacteria bacterium RIFOXYB2_FULL_35_12]|nr:MAG: hypothetical protein A2058_04650 [Ignavibacteria bacterium GWA2_36_19]OGU58964.1 MAG: hypothetical protein A2X60_09095 [Ignavibacteria bacterium GWF2_35_20]OGU77386.1 MAG: hypothetical protein A2W11_05940 [Ignavibacteria bacterium RBG_16_35_7]OGU80800.1 MAG: hypothetical protein A2254_16540 [Ignavibacteria bacterium RIFOXYA2_FULL_35_9]OGU86123.1 MAG: hypothetical protein A3K31_12905 [Ignavibacteria bacterium RIFOXYA12_FULL_35_25]OGU92808.1 MAG: hypothetical protein A2492_11405 [Ignavib